MIRRLFLPVQGGVSPPIRHGSLLCQTRHMDHKGKNGSRHTSSTMNNVGYLPPLIIILAIILGSGCLQEEKSVETAITNHESMLRRLGNVTNSIQDSLLALDSTMSGAATALGTTGLSGPDADAFLFKAVASNPSIINVITYDPNGTVLAAMPDTTKVIIGKDLSGSEIVRHALTIQKPVMSDLIVLAEGGEGAVLSHPVFSYEGTFTGVVSMAFSPYALIRPIAEAETDRNPYTWMVAQTDGRILYDPDPLEVGKETFNETLFAEFPEIIELARLYSVNRTGYDTYSFYSTGPGNVVSKETFWDTIELHGTEWRVLVISEV